jgi:hypothetical protein
VLHGVQPPLRSQFHREPLQSRTPHHRWPMSSCEPGHAHQVLHRIRPVPVEVIWSCALQASLDTSQLSLPRAELAKSSSQIGRAWASSWSKMSQHRKLGLSQVLARSKTSQLASQVLETLEPENYLQAFLTQ